MWRAWPGATLAASGRLIDNAASLMAVWTPVGCGVAITSNITPAANTEPGAYANEPEAALSWVPS